MVDQFLINKLVLLSIFWTLIKDIEHFSFTYYYGS